MATNLDVLVLDARGRVTDLETSATSSALRDRTEKVVRRHTVVIVKDTDDAMASTTTAETPIYTVPAHMADGMKLVSVQLCAKSTSAADTTNTIVISLSKRDGAGGGATVVAQRSTDSDTADTFGNLGTAITAFVPTAFSLGTDAQRTLSAGQILTFNVAKNGAGVVLSSGELTLVVDEL